MAPRCRRLLRISLADFELVLFGSPAQEVDLRPLQKAVAKLNSLGLGWLKKGVMNLKLVDDAEIRALNSEYSGNNYATDVLSFSYVEESRIMNHESRELGDIAISCETAKRQADEHGLSLADEIAKLGLHGILHIFGMDHAKAKDKDAMDKLQKDILTAVGVTYKGWG